ncbi:MAG: SLBB domain-containing protein [Armatimonadota bacterium]
MKRSMIFLIFIVLLSFSIVDCYAQDYVIKSGDTLHITVLDEADLTKNAVVDPQGNITLPMINQIKAAGLTTIQATEQIAAKLKQFIKNPQVSVELVESAKIQVTVSGEVKSPGIITLSNGARLLDAITSADGYTQTADLSNVTISNTGNTAASTVIDLNKFLISGDVSVNVLVKNGDTIVIPTKETAIIGTVSVLGAVRQGGQHNITNGMTLREAVMLAGGPTDLADLKNVTVRHEGTADIITIDYTKASAGEATSNPALKPGDVIYVSAKGQLGYFTVNGAVASPGRYEIKEKTTITEAISVAGGVKDNAKLDSARIVRNADGSNQVIKADLHDIFNGKDPNIPIQDGDNIWVDKKKGGPDYMRLLSVAISLGWLLTNK